MRLLKPPGRRRPVKTVWHRLASSGTVWHRLAPSPSVHCNTTDIGRLAPYVPVDPCLVTLLLSLTGKVTADQAIAILSILFLWDAMKRLTA